MYIGSKTQDRVNRSYRVCSIDSKTYFCFKHRIAGLSDGPIDSPDPPLVFSESGRHNFQMITLGRFRKAIFIAVLLENGNPGQLQENKEIEQEYLAVERVLALIDFCFSGLCEFFLR